MSRSHTLFERIRREEAGLGMLEVLASALLVVIISVGVLKTFDAANAATGNTKARAIAADLAQQDQERMRAFRAKELSNINETPPGERTVAGVKYEITSNAIWVNDGSGSRRCGLTSGRADYLRIRSTVTWENMLGAAPVTSTSLYAPPSGSFGDEGNLGFEILDRSAVGVPGASVSLAGPAVRSGVADSDGCVFFAFLPQGEYTATITKPGYVDYNGNATITKTFGVTGGTTQVQPLDYDQAGTVTASIRSWRTTTTTGPPPTVAAQAGHVSFGHSQYNAPFWKYFGTGTLRSSFGAAEGLNAFFPFTSSYSLYTGTCAPNSGMATTVPALAPGGSVSVNVNEPGLQIRAAASGTTGSTPFVTMPQGTTVTLTPRSTGCSGMMTLRLDSAGWVGPTNVSTTVDPGVPYGAYDICASYNSRKRIRTNVLVDGPTGDSVIVPNTGSEPSGSCP